MNPSIQQALTDQANHELLASHQYLAMAMWCEDHDYLGFASYFYKQSKEEHDHARKFCQHLLDRDVQPPLIGIEPPRNDYKKLIEVAEQAQILERRNSENIHRCYDISQEVKDFASQPMLLELIEEQVEEESWAETMVTLTRRAECSGATYNLDRHIVSDLTIGVKEI